MWQITFTEDVPVASVSGFIMSMGIYLGDDGGAGGLTSVQRPSSGQSVG